MKCFFSVSVPSQRNNHPLPPQTSRGWPCDPGRRTGLYHSRQLRRSRSYRRKYYGNDSPFCPNNHCPPPFARSSCRRWPPIGPTGCNRPGAAHIFRSFAQEWTLTGCLAASRASFSRRKLIVMVTPSPLILLFLVASPLSGRKSALLTIFSF